MTETDPRYTHRASALDEAKTAITQQRNKSYGEPDEDFRRIAAIASAMGFRINTGDGQLRELRSSDVALFMIALKTSRLMWSPAHRDSWVDIAGYAGCGFETAELTRERAAEAAQITPAEYLEQAGLKPMVHAIKGGDWERRSAAMKAMRGDPKDLEEMGLFLGDADSLSDDDCEADWHSFSGRCAYRIYRRRSDA